jgi:hypothetical protein
VFPDRGRWDRQSFHLTSSALNGYVYREHGVVRGPPPVFGKFFQIKVLRSIAVAAQLPLYTREIEKSPQGQRAFILPISSIANTNIFVDCSLLQRQLFSFVRFHFRTRPQVCQRQQKR